MEAGKIVLGWRVRDTLGVQMLLNTTTSRALCTLHNLNTYMTSSLCIMLSTKTNYFKTYFPRRLPQCTTSYYSAIHQHSRTLPHHTCPTMCAHTTCGLKPPPTHVLVGRHPVSSHLTMCGKLQLEVESHSPEQKHPVSSLLELDTQAVQHQQLATLLHHLFPVCQGLGVAQQGVVAHLQRQKRVGLRNSAYTVDTCLNIQILLP